MQIEISQSRQFKCSIVCVVKDAISYNCFLTIMQHFAKMLLFAKCFISRHQMAQLVFRVFPIVMCITLRLSALFDIPAFKVVLHK